MPKTYYKIGAYTRPGDTIPVPFLYELQLEVKRGGGGYSVASSKGMVSGLEHIQYDRPTVSNADLSHAQPSGKLFANKGAAIDAYMTKLGSRMSDEEARRARAVMTLDTLRALEKAMEVLI